MPLTKSKRVAIIHDWLVTIGGAERVLKEILYLFPKADIFTIIDTLSASKDAPNWLKKRKIKTSFLNRVPFIQFYYQKFIYLMPNLIEMFDLRDYDIIISSSHAVAKGIITHPNQIHIAYIYTPMRYAWDMMYQYDELNSFKRGLFRLWTLRRLHYLRIWDVISSNRADKIVTISKFISKRVKNSWGKESIVLYPPVDTSFNSENIKKEEFYITASRFVEYKRVDLIIEAFNRMPNRKLIIIGNGLIKKRLKKRASKNIIFREIKDDNEKLNYFAKAKAFIFIAKEDFGITPLEANSCGTPVIAYRDGAVIETMRNIDTSSPSALLFEKQNSENLIEAIEEFEKKEFLFTRENCIKNAKRFSTENFRENFKLLVENLIKA